MLSDLEKAYEYLESHDLVAAFVHNCETASNNFKLTQSNRHGSFIRQAFKWSETSEDDSFWNAHDDAILRLQTRLSAKDVLNYIELQQQTPKSYEYW